MWQNKRKNSQDDRGLNRIENLIRIRALIGEYRDLGKAISQSSSSAFQIFSVGIGAISIATAVGLFRAERIVLLVIPIFWALLTLQVMRMYRVVLAMGAARADIERILAEECGVSVLLWESVVVPAVIHKRFFSWIENGLLLAVLVGTEVAACWTAHLLQVEDSVPLWGEIVYDVLAAVMLILIMMSLFRTIGTSRRTYLVITKHRNKDVAPSSRRN